MKMTVCFLAQFSSLSSRGILYRVQFVQCKVFVVWHFLVRKISLLNLSTPNTSGK